MTTSSAASDYKVVAMTTSGAANDYKVVAMTTSSAANDYKVVAMTTSSAANDYKVSVLNHCFLPKGPVMRKSFSGDLKTLWLMAAQATHSSRCEIADHLVLLIGVRS